MIDVKQITDLHAHTVKLWHEEEIENPYDGLLALVCDQHKYNFLLWHEEDIARSHDVGDARIAQVKRNIDRYNQQRNDWIEKIDDHLLQEVYRRGIVIGPDTPFNSETPASIIDRLSILSLRIFHMEEQLERMDVSDEHLRKTQSKLDIIRIQHHDLAQALAELLDDIFSGKKQLKLYRQFKMYNDPALNPYLYQRGKKAG